MAGYEKFGRLHRFLMPRLAICKIPIKIEGDLQSGHDDGMNGNLTFESKKRIWNLLGKFWFYVLHPSG